MVNDSIGIILLVAGVILLAVELIHPGALLLIPASVLLMAGFLWILFPSLLDSDLGIVLIVVAATAGALLEIPYYRWVAPVHAPMSTTVGTLVGQEGIIIASVEPDTLRGKVRIGSEVWSARADVPISPGTHVRVVAGSGVSVSVEALPPGPGTEKEGA